MNDNKKAAHKHFSTAQELLLAGELERAITELDKAISIDPDYIEYYLNRGSVYRQLGNYESALNDFDKAIDRASDQMLQLAGYYERAVLYHLCNHYEQAIADYTRVIALHPKFPVAYVNRGIAYEEWGKIQEAIADFQRFIKLSKDKKHKSEISKRVERLRVKMG
jgi:tetratricopeptide (TPR) repeat protein